MHESGKTCAGSDKHSIKAFFGEQIVNLARSADDDVCLNLNAQIPDVLDFLFHNLLLGQTEFRNAVGKYAAGFVESFENLHLIAELCQIARTGQSRRTCPDDGDTLSVLFFRAFRTDSHLARGVGDIALQLADGNRLTFDAADTFSLALGFLRADTAADSGKGTGLADHGISARNIGFLHLRDESGDIDADRAALYTHRIFAVQTSGSFRFRFFFIVTETDFFEIRRADLRILLAHRYLLHHIDWHFPTSLLFKSTKPECCISGSGLQPQFPQPPWCVFPS